MSQKKNHLEVEFTTEAAFRSEYLGNIANGGAFIATSEVFSVRDQVVVDIHLRFCDQSISLEGEVVHVVTSEMASNGAQRGVAVQFELSTRELKERFLPVVGPVVEGNERVTKRGRRTAPRAPARVKVEISSEGFPDYTTESRDLSVSGISTSVEEYLIPVGDMVELRLTHPKTAEQMSVGGRVVRHLESRDGEITAMGIQFEIPDARKTEFSAFINDVRAAEHTRRLTGITGPIAELGIENVLQMFGASSPRGTLVFTRGGDQGAISFEGGALRMAKLGTRRGLEAFRELLTWSDGNFEFLTRPEIDESQGLDVSLSAAILESLCEIDKSAAEKQNPGLAEAMDRAHRGIDAPAGAKPKGTRSRAKPASGAKRSEHLFEVDLDAANAHRSELDKIEEAVLDLALVGMSLERMTDVIPEPDLDIFKALDALQERGVLRPA